MTHRAQTPPEPPLPFVGTRLLLSRRELVGAPTGVPAPERAQLWSVVAEGRPSMVLLARQGDLRRLDLWVDGAGLVVHGWQSDEDVPAEATHHPLAVAPVAVARLLDLTEAVASSPAASIPPGGTDPVHVTELVHRATSGSLAAGAHVVVVARQDPRPSTGIVRLHEPGSTRWSSFTGDDIDGFTSTEPLAWFTALLRTLDLCQDARP